MKDFFDSLYHQVRDRLSSPIFGSFVIAWICWNHRYLILLFSDLPAPDRFMVARSVLYPSGWELWSHFLVWPFLSCIGYLLVYPHVSKPLLVYWDKQQGRLTELRNEAQKKTLLTKEESQRLILDTLDQRTKFEETLERQRREIAALKTAMDSGPDGKLTERIGALERELERERASRNPDDPLNAHPANTAKGVREIIKVLAVASNQTQHIKDVTSKLGVSQLMNTVLVEAALSSGLVSYSGPNSQNLTLTSDGRRYVVAHGLEPSPQGPTTGRTAASSATT